MANAKYDGWARRGFAYAHQVALTNTAQRVRCRRDAGVAGAIIRPESFDFPAYGRVRRVLVQLDTIAGGAATVTVRLYRDSDGDHLLLWEQAMTIRVGRTTATSGTAYYDVPEGGTDVPYIAGYATSGVEDSIYADLVLNVGTAKGNVEVHFMA